MHRECNVSYNTQGLFETMNIIRKFLKIALQIPFIEYQQQNWVLDNFVL